MVIPCSESQGFKLKTVGLPGPFLPVVPKFYSLMFKHRMVAETSALLSKILFLDF